MMARLVLPHAHVPEAQKRARFRKFFARKNQSDFTVFVAQRHPVVKRSLPRHPANVNTLRGVDPGTARIESLMAKGLLASAIIADSAHSRGILVIKPTRPGTYDSSIQPAGFKID